MATFWSNDMSFQVFYGIVNNATEVGKNIPGKTSLLFKFEETHEKVILSLRQKYRFLPRTENDGNYIPGRD